MKRNSKKLQTLQVQQVVPVLSEEDHPVTMQLVAKGTEALKQPAFAPARVLVRELLKRVIRLTFGNQFMDAQYRLVKTENRDLYRLLSAIVMQNGGRLIVDEKIWQSTPGNRKLLGQITSTKDTALKLTDEPLAQRRLPTYVLTFFDGDGKEQGMTDLELSTRELTRKGQGEPLFLPMFDPTRIYEGRTDKP